MGTDTNNEPGVHWAAGETGTERGPCGALNQRCNMYAKKRKKKKQKQKLKAREQSWGVDINAKLPKYNALTDPNLRHHFESRKIQSHLLKSGLIDHQGRVIDIDAAKSKLAVIEREFRNAEKSEFQRMRDEAEMRRRVQKKRHEALEISRRQEMIAKVHEDRKIRRAILKIQKDQVYSPPTHVSIAKKKKPKARSSDRLPPVKVDVFCLDSSLRELCLTFVVSCALFVCHSNRKD